MSSALPASAQLRTAYSARVEMRLVLGERAVRVAQLGPDFLILKDRTSVRLPPLDGWMEICIDDSIRRWPVRLPEGTDPARERTPIVSLAD